MHGKLCGTYETSQTRKFHHGRTETIRSASIEALEFSKALHNPAVPAAEKIKLYR